MHCKEKAFTYNECIACCPTSCQPRAACVDSEIACVDGCYCPDGMLGMEGVPDMAGHGLNVKQGLGGCLCVE